MPRFTMLELIREYGFEQLVGSGEITMIRGQHAAYYLQLAEQAAPELAGGQAQIAWFARIGAELDNIRAALRNHWRSVCGRPHLWCGRSTPRGDQPGAAALRARHG